LCGLWSPWLKVQEEWKIPVEDWRKLRGWNRPTAVAWGEGKIQVVGRNFDGSVVQVAFDRNANWAGWANLDGPKITGGPAIASWGPNRLDIFAQSGGALWHKWFDSHKWSDWENMTTVTSHADPIRSDPAAVSWEKDRIDIFYLDENDNLWQRFFHFRSGWQKPIPISQDSRGNRLGPFQGRPAVTSRSPNKLDIIIGDAGNQTLTHIMFDNSIGRGFIKGPTIKAPNTDTRVDFRLGGDPAVVARNTEKIDVFIKDYPGEHQVDRMSIVPTSNRYSAWEATGPLGPNIASCITASSWAPNRLDIFAASPTSGSDRELFHKWIEGLDAIS
jgi:hypothetical protein